MKKLRIEMGKHSIHYDTNYGQSNRTGWSYAHDGSFVVQFESFISMIGEIIKHQKRLNSAI